MFMNMQAVMKQAQAMQKEMLKVKDEIDHTEFVGENGFVKVKINGAKEILEVKIASEKLEKEDIELLEDMLLIAMNSALKQVDEITEKKMGKFSSSMPGLF